LPHEGRGEDGATTKDKEEKSGRGFHKTINKRGRETSWTHCGCKSNKDVNLLVQLRVNAQGSKGLRSSLTETNVTETGCTGNLEDIFNRVRDVMPRKVINGEVPKLVRVGVMVDRLFGVLVSTVVAKPHVITQLCENKGNGTFWACETNPYLGIHEKTVVQVDDWFACGSAGDWTRLTPWTRDAVNSEKVTILGEDNVLFNVVIPKYGA
jgi:hypothetical protein